MKEVNLRPLVTHNLLKTYGREATPAAPGGSFGALLAASLEQTGAAHQRGAAALPAAVLDQGIEVHQVMIAQEEASITFELLMEVRNKLMEGYQQLMQMQV